MLAIKELERLPRGDGRGANSCSRIVAHTGKEAPKLNDGSQLTTLLPCGPNCGGIGFGNNEHANSMILRSALDK